MALVDPYSPCPCGSGQKFKWCCQKVESFAEKAERLYEGNQIDAALAALDEGLRKVPDNPWLLTRKALIHARRGEVAEAKPLLERVIATQPGHIGAHGLLVRAVLETDGPEAGVAQLQQALSAASAMNRAVLTPLVQVVGMFLGEVGLIPAALKHMELAQTLLPDDDPMMASSVRALEGNPAASPWLRNPYQLAPAPTDLGTDQRARFDQAIGWAEEGLWAPAASAFDTLAADGVTRAERNLGLCRLWLADEQGAVEALRRAIAQVGPTEDAVDLEALCQAIAPPTEDDLVDQIRLIWPLKQRDELLAALQASDRVQFEGRGPLEPDDPNSFEVDLFTILDRPKPVKGAMLTVDSVPRIIGHARVGLETVFFDTDDNPKLDNLISQFRDLAGAAIPPAHPKTKVVDKISRSGLALAAEWFLPDWINPVELNQIQRAERSRVINQVWPETPMPYLGGRTPRQAARAGDAEVPLRAAVYQLELSHTFFREGIDFAAIRAEYNLGDEPAIDPETVDVDQVHLGRLHHIPANRLDDDRLLTLWDRARRYVLPMAMENATKAIANRPALLDREEVNRVTVFSDLANLALSRYNPAEAFDWLAKGRQGEPDSLHSQNAARWDMAEVRLRSRSEAPSLWVPHLAVVLERYRNDQASSMTILSNLVDMGLIKMEPHPDKPEEVILDSRSLQAVLSQFGPKITTAGGELGVSATRGGIWTPGGDTASGSSGGIWTPGGPPPFPG
ncbi:MAG: hypothetical protein ABI353_00965 [Isosphaeraceae bacterium]